MRRLRPLAAAALVAAAIALSPRPAAAQQVVAQGPFVTYYSSGYVTNPWPTYSYYATPPGLPARVYVGYPGASEPFPFYGRPYGNPSDRWSWSTLGGMGGAPARYFYPPVP